MSLVQGGLFIVTHHLITYFRCQRTSSPNYPLGLLIGLLYTNFTRLNSSAEGRSSAVDCITLAATLFRWAGAAAGAVFSHTP